MKNIQKRQSYKGLSKEQAQQGLTEEKGRLNPRVFAKE